MENETIKKDETCQNKEGKCCTKAKCCCIGKIVLSLTAAAFFISGTVFFALAISMMLKVGSMM